VDCTTEGKALCEQHGVNGYPSIKYGDPSALEDYNGGRSLKDLQDFAKENLKPMCSPANIDLCDADKKAQIEGFIALGSAALEEKVAEKKKENTALEETFENEVKKLQEKYEQLQKDKEEGQKQVKESGLGLMQAVLGHLKTAKTEL